jgi:hypothetical protein
MVVCIVGFKTSNDDFRKRKTQQWCQFGNETMVNIYVNGIMHRGKKCSCSKRKMIQERTCLQWFWDIIDKEIPPHSLGCHGYPLLGFCTTWVFSPYGRGLQHTYIILPGLVAWACNPSGVMWALVIRMHTFIGGCVVIKHAGPVLVWGQSVSRFWPQKGGVPSFAPMVLFKKVIQILKHRDN